MKTLHFFIDPSGVLKVIQEMPEQPNSYEHHKEFNPIVGMEWDKYNQAIQNAKDEAIEVVNQDDVLSKLFLKYKDEHKINASIGEWISQSTDKIYSLEGCGIEITNFTDDGVVVTRGTKYKKEGSTDLKPVIKKALITFEEPKDQNKPIDKMKTAREILKFAFERAIVKYPEENWKDWNDKDVEVTFIIEAMEEYANQSRWISVKERLPEKGKYVMVFWYETCRIGEWSGEKWLDQDGLEFIDPVNHWQPLPEGPKE